MISAFALFNIVWFWLDESKGIPPYKEHMDRNIKHSQ